MTGPSRGGRRLLVELSAALASRDRGRLGGALGAALREGADTIAVEEVLLQAYLFLGYPASLEALALWRELSGREAPEASPFDPAGWTSRGEGVCREVYGDKYEKLRWRVRTLHPDLEAWMVTEGYGKVLARTGLPLKTRELCIVGLLAVLGAPRQLHAHLRGALNVGATEVEVEEALAWALPSAVPDRARLAREVWGEVQGRWRARSGEGGAHVDEGEGT